MKRINMIVADQHPLMLNGIKNFLNQKPSIFRLQGIFSDLLHTVRKCNDEQADILLLGEFTNFLNGPELIRWVSHRLNSTKIIAYLENTPHLDSETLLSAGVCGCVWKTSPECHLEKAIITVNDGYYFFDDKAMELHSVGQYATEKENLTHRESQVLQLIVSGLTNKEIAKTLILSSKTIETHRLNLMKKLNAHNSIELLKAAIKIGACSL